MARKKGEGRIFEKPKGSGKYSLRIRKKEGEKEIKLGKFKSRDSAIKAAEKYIKDHAEILIAKDQEVLEKLNQLKLEIIDTTCMMVRKIYRAGLELEEEGRSVIIVGDKDHPEVKGIASRLTAPLIVNRISDVEGINLPEKLGIICQSTSIEADFHNIVAYITGRISDVKIEKTICAPTLNRQKSAIALTKKADIMIVIGGEHSSNTIKLKKLASSYSETPNT